jgi:hypothetical protein
MSMQSMNLGFKCLMFQRVNHILTQFQSPFHNDFILWCCTGYEHDETSCNNPLTVDPQKDDSSAFKKFISLHRLELHNPRPTAKCPSSGYDVIKDLPIKMASPLISCSPPSGFRAFMGRYSLSLHHVMLSIAGPRVSCVRPRTEH